MLDFAGTTISDEDISVSPQDDADIRAVEYKIDATKRLWAISEIGAPAYRVIEFGGDDWTKTAFEASSIFYLSSNASRDRAIASRLTELFRDAISESEKLNPDSVEQFASFFTRNSTLGAPKITATPDGTLRARWILSAGFVAIEFIGDGMVKLAAEIPRKGFAASLFATDEVSRAIAVIRSIGGSFPNSR